MHEGTAEQLSVDEVYARHADFVWAQLQRFGVRETDLDDALQEVFVVVHRRLAEFDGRSRLTTWLYAIAMRVARAHWRSRKRDQIAPEPEIAAPSSPECNALQTERRRLLDHLLEQLDPEKRAVLVMFEIDELPCDEIASILDVPLGTVYSRLHAARRSFASALERMRKRHPEVLA